MFSTPLPLLRASIPRLPPSDGGGVAIGKGEIAARGGQGKGISRCGIDTKTRASGDGQRTCRAVTLK